MLRNRSIWHIFAHNYLGMFESITTFLSSTPPTDIRMILILIAVGTFVGFINTIAGMATALSYALFMLMGMPINVANGTTRVGVLLQFMTTSVIFKKEGYLDFDKGLRAGIPVGIGAIFGAFLAVALKVSTTEVVMAILLPIISLLLFVDRKKINATASQEFTIWKYLIFLIIGIYGGFTHSGVGILIMFASFYFLGMDMISANGIKQFAVVIYTPLALLIFALSNHINWEVGLLYAIGNIFGGILGSYTSIRGGEKFTKIFVTIIILLMSILLIVKQFK